MLLFKQFMPFTLLQITNDDKKRKYHLIQAISIEFLLVNIFLIGLSAYFNFKIITGLLILNAAFLSAALALLKKKNTLILCAHILNSLCVLMVSSASLWLGGTASNFSLDWFYISPILATVTIGIHGLLIYGSLSGFMLLVLLSLHLPAFYTVSAGTLSILNYVSPVFLFLLICTILYGLLIENRLYEALLKEQNFLLSADKKKFHYLSHHDTLTNLPNRSYFNTHLQELIDTINPKQTAITLYFMDLDNFKKINDLYGHEVGDMLLLQTGKRLQSCFRGSDFIARLGGDEFTAIITHNLKDKIADVLAARIQKEFEAPFLINKIEINCSLSLGIATYPGKAQNADMLLKRADEQMYKNKKKRAAEASVK